jgi:Ankyrin repeats (3 copies)
MTGGIQLGHLALLPPKEMLFQKVDKYDSGFGTKEPSVQLIDTKGLVNYHPYLAALASKSSGMKHIVSMPTLIQLDISLVADIGYPKNSTHQPIFKRSLLPKSTIKLSRSAPSLEALVHPQSNTHIAAGATATTLTIEEDSSSPFSGTNPTYYLRHLIEAAGQTYLTYPSLSLDNFFLKTTPVHIHGYQTDVIMAVRKDDVYALRKLHESGRTMQACNKFGESIVHMACRRGSTEIMKFLMDEAGVTIGLRDDYGRTPLHDALWTCKPAFDLVKLILQVCPDLLFTTDKRGFTPFSYVRRDHWVPWCQFLDDNKDLVLPKKLFTIIGA